MDTRTDIITHFQGAINPLDIVDQLTQHYNPKQFITCLFFISFHSYYARPPCCLFFSAIKCREQIKTAYRFSIIKDFLFSLPSKICTINSKKEQHKHNKEDESKKKAADLKNK